MNCTFEELIEQYLTTKVFVSIQELLDEELLKEFCVKVEKAAPTSRGYYSHMEMFSRNESLLKHIGETSMRKYYFRLCRRTRGNVVETFGMMEETPPQNKIAHLVYNIPPVDMEGLLAE